MLDALLPAHLVVHVAEAGDDIRLAVFQLHPGKLDPVVAGTGFKHAAEEDGVEQPFLRIALDALRAGRLQQRGAVLLQNQPGIDGKRVGEFCVFDRLAGRHHVRQRLIDTEQLKALALHILDDPDRVIGLGQSFDDSRALELFALRLLALLRDVGEEDVVQVLVQLRVDEIVVFVEPADLAVLADDAVFQVVRIGLVAVRALPDRGKGHAAVVRVDHPAQVEAGVGLEIVKVLAAVELTHAVVGIEQLAALVRLADEEAAGHVVAKLLDHRETVFVLVEPFPAELVALVRGLKWPELLSGLHVDIGRLQRLRLVIQIALGKLAADLLQKGPLLLGFQTLGQGVDAHFPRHLDHGVHDTAVRTVVVVQVAQQVHIEFDQIHVEAAERVERGIAAAEVVQPDAEAQLLQPPDLLVEAIRRPRHILLRDLHDQIFLFGVTIQ